MTAGVALIVCLAVTVMVGFVIATVVHQHRGRSRR